MHLERQARPGVHRQRRERFAVEADDVVVFDERNVRGHGYVRAAMKAPASRISSSGWSRCGEWPQSRDDEELGLRHAPRDRPDLLERAVLVVFALHREHRARDRLDVALDVPVAKRRRQPDVVPAAERRVGIVVVLREAAAQVAGLEGHARLLDAGDGDVLDEQMRRDRDDAGDRMARGMQQRDRRAVAVTEEPGPLDADCGEEPRQDVVRLLGHEVDAPALAGRLGRRAAVAVAREHEAGQPVPLAERRAGSRATSRSSRALRAGRRRRGAVVRRRRPTRTRGAARARDRPS